MFRCWIIDNHWCTQKSLSFIGLTLTQGQFNFQWPGQGKTKQRKSKSVSWYWLFKPVCSVVSYWGCAWVHQMNHCAVFCLHCRKQQHSSWRHVHSASGQELQSGPATQHRSEGHKPRPEPLQHDGNRRRYKQHHTQLIHAGTLNQTNWYSTQRPIIVPIYQDIFCISAIMMLLCFQAETVYW